MVEAHTTHCCHNPNCRMQELPHHRSPKPHRVGCWMHDALQGTPPISMPCHARRA
jgi:hypothetical protein